MKTVEQAGLQAFVPGLPARPRPLLRGRWATAADVATGGGLLALFGGLVLDVHDQPMPAVFVTTLAVLGGLFGGTTGPGLRTDRNLSRPCLWRLLRMAVLLGFVLGGWTGLDMASTVGVGESLLVFGMWGIVGAVLGCCTGILPLVAIAWGVFFAAVRGHTPGWEEPAVLDAGRQGS